MNLEILICTQIWLFLEVSCTTNENACSKTIEINVVDNK